jgi:hypothetical protein
MGRWLLRWETLVAKMVHYEWHIVNYLLWSRTNHIWPSLTNGFAANRKLQCKRRSSLLPYDSSKLSYRLINCEFLKFYEMG